MLRTILLELFLPFRPFIKTANIGRTTISAQTVAQTYSVYNQPRTQASSRHLSYQRRLGTERESEFSLQASQVTSQPKSPRTTGNEAASLTLATIFANLLEKQTSKNIYIFLKNQGKYYLPLTACSTDL